MDEDIPLAGGEVDPFEARVLGRFDAPAYVRRARAVQEALDGLLAVCRKRRAEWSEMARLRLGTLHALSAAWEGLRPLLPEDQMDVLRALYDELRPVLRMPVEPTRSTSALRRALGELLSSLERFNQRWLRFVPEVDLSAVNGLRADYNRYYILEKECAVRSPALARRNFQRLEPLTTDDLLRLLPPLPVPRPPEARG